MSDLGYCLFCSSVVKLKAAYIFLVEQLFIHGLRINLNFVPLIAVKSVTVAICYPLPRKLFTVVPIC
jgi:hypothetical protein